MGFKDRWQLWWICTCCFMLYNWTLFFYLMGCIQFILWQQQVNDTVLFVKKFKGRILLRPSGNIIIRTRCFKQNYKQCPWSLCTQYRCNRTGEPCGRFFLTYAVSCFYKIKTDFCCCFFRVVAINGNSLNVLMQHSEAVLRIMAPVTVYVTLSHLC
jgi:hypothetical protein